MSLKFWSWGNQESGWKTVWKTTDPWWAFVLLLRWASEHLVLSSGKLAKCGQLSRQNSISWVTGPNKCTYCDRQWKQDRDSWVVRLPVHCSMFFFLKHSVYTNLWEHLCRGVDWRAVLSLQLQLFCWITSRSSHEGSPPPPNSQP